MDFRTDRSSWLILIFMLATFMYFVLAGASKGLSFVGYLQAFGISLLAVISLIALLSIPVLIYCYFAKVIPDIDYSIRAGGIVTVIGIISEFIF